MTSIYPRLFSISKIQSVSLCISLAILLSCEEPNKNPRSSVEELISGDNWKLAAWTSEPAYPYGSYAYTSIIKLYKDINKPCLNDQLFNIANGKDDSDYAGQQYEYYEGKGECNVSNPLERGTWSIATNSNGIYIYFTNKLNTNSATNTQLYKVEEISNGRLVISKRYQISGASTIYTWKKTYTTK